MSETTVKIKNNGLLTIVTGRDRKEMSWEPLTIQWSQLVEKMSKTKRTSETVDQYKKMTKDRQSDLKDIGGYVGGILKGGRRKAEEVVSRTLITLDIDYAKGDIWASVEVMLGCACVMHSTHSHNLKNTRLRLVIPMSRETTPDEHEAIARMIAADLGIDFFDDTTYEPHRLMYWPSTSSDGEYVFKCLDEPWLDPDTVLARYPDWRDVSSWPRSSRTKQTRQKLANKQEDPLSKKGVVGAFCQTYSISAALETFLGDVYGPVGDGRYTFLAGSTVGGLVVYDGDTFAYSHHSTDPISGKLVNAFDLVRLHKFGDLDEDAEPGTPSKLPSYKAMAQLLKDDERVQQTIEEIKALQAGEDFAQVAKAGAPGGTDLANARLLAKHHGDDFRFCNGGWLAWDGQRFISDTTDNVWRAAKAIAEILAVTATELNTAEAWKTAKYAASARGLGAMVKLFGSEPGIAVAHTQLDTYPETFNVVNGTLNLRTGELYKHRREDLLTKLSPVVYDPEAQCPTWSEFLYRAMSGNKEHIEYLQTAVGITLSGIYVKLFFFLYGPPDSGKSKFVECLRILLGDYAKGMDIEILAEKGKSSNGPTPEIARLFGARMVACSETSNGKRINEALLKRITGQDVLSARHLHKETFDFTPVFKLWLHGNHRPHVRDDSAGVWERLALIPFEVSIPKDEQDPLLLEKFEAELSGILNWALAGCRRWMAGGCRVPKLPSKFRAAVDRYKADMDLIGQFIEDQCSVEVGFGCQSSELYNAYNGWCKSLGHYPLSHTRFSTRMQERGFKKSRGKKGFFFQDIKPHNEFTTDETFLV